RDKTVAAGVDPWPPARVVAPREAGGPRRLEPVGRTGRRRGLGRGATFCCRVTALVFTDTSARRPGCGKAAPGPASDTPCLRLTRGGGGVRRARARRAGRGATGAGPADVSVRRVGSLDPPRPAPPRRPRHPAGRVRSGDTL